MQINKTNWGKQIECALKDFTLPYQKQVNLSKLMGIVYFLYQNHVRDHVYLLWNHMPSQRIFRE